MALMSENEAKELGLYTRVSEMEPMLVENGELEDLAASILEGSAALSAILPDQTRSGLQEMLRIVNSYYSNLIEGNSTHPIDIERATRKDYSGDPAKRNRQIESVAHIECQRAIESRLAAEPEVPITSPDWLCWVHKCFYDQLPDELRQVKNEETSETLEVVGGEPRERDVRVSRHVGPASAFMPRFLDRYHEVYGRRMHGISPIIATAAAHHRLMWIHPFLDGNGRVARLCTDASFRKLLKGYGVWNVSRGLARRRDAYYTALANADAPRQGDLDGRGNLSKKGLEDFIKFFLEICLDQIEYMRSVLRIDGLLDRLNGYVTLRQLGMAPYPPDAQKLRPQAAYLLQEVLIRGEVSRGDVSRITGLGDRLGRSLVSSLVKERLLVSPMPQGGLRLGFPSHAVEYYFPGLFPPTGGVA
ncbi:Fic family protein [Geobacter sp. DSM 9736]|uniref:Fic family protein n=1 Tax=Geobacter sp. DSM 9736 TaxID=1277350 RepID=UPI000B5FF696|nr:Fic family protein [Geobacter sp. DSM 9736]SNB46260.1 Fic family protein [Geobacter sp. DSM 9736]